MKSFTSTLTAPIFKLICCVSLLFCTQQIKACGPDFSGYYLTYLLEHYKLGNRYYELQFDPESKYYNKGYDYNESEIDYKKVNINAWKKILNINTNNEDELFTNALYSSNSIAEFISKLEVCTTYNNAIKSGGNGKELMQYFTYLFTYKSKYAPTINDWDYGKYTKNISTETIKPFCQELENLIASEKNNAIQLRYLYLLLRTAHLNQHSLFAIEVFEKHKNIFINQNIIEQMWCEGIAGGAYQKANQQAKGIYFTARVFSKSEDKFTEALRTYNSSNQDWQGALAYCKNTADSIAVLLLPTAKNPMPDTKMLKTIYNLNPNHEAIQLLWLREANKLETYLLNAKNNDYLRYDNNTENEVNITAKLKEENYVQEMMELANIMIENKNTKYKATIANMLAYYAYRIKQNAIAKNYIAIAKKEQKNDIENKQTNLLQELISIQETKKINPENIINLLETNSSKEKYSIASHINHYLLYNEIAPLYLQNADTNSAYWCYAYCNVLDADSTGAYIGNYSPESFNTSTFDTYLLLHKFGIKDIEKLENQYQIKKGNNALVDYMIPKTNFVNGKKSFAELKAKKYMMMQQWDKAIELLPQLPASYLDTKIMNPVNVDYNDIINHTPKMDSMRTFTIAKILQLASTLKKNADKKIAKDQYLYGVLLYNLSYYGKAHNIVDNHWMHTTHNASSYYKTDSIDAYLYQNEKEKEAQMMSPLFYNYFYCTDAEAYLHKSLNGLVSPEEKANCVWMMAKCWQKRCPVNIAKDKEYGYIISYGDYVGNALKNPYFKQLINEYSNTNSYQNVKGSCDYFKMYLTR
jgi:hypothetical protein